MKSHDSPTRATIKSNPVRTESLNVVIYCLSSLSNVLFAHCQRVCPKNCSSFYYTHCHTRAPSCVLFIPPGAFDHNNNNVTVQNNSITVFVCILVSLTYHPTGKSSDGMCPLILYATHMSVLPFSLLFLCLFVTLSVNVFKCVCVYCLLSFFLRCKTIFCLCLSV